MKLCFLAVRAPWDCSPKANYHRIIGWKRPLRPSSPTVTSTPPCLLNRVLKCHSYMFFEHLWAGDSTTALGSLFQRLPNYSALNCKISALQLPARSLSQHATPSRSRAPQHFAEDVSLLKFRGGGGNQSRATHILQLPPHEGHVCHLEETGSAEAPQRLRPLTWTQLLLLLPTAPHRALPAPQGPPLTML